MGATDSAAPCAILLDVAEALNPLLDNHKALLEDEHEDNPAAYTTLQLIFFDGEEAFKDWTNTDSIYGARCVHKSSRRDSVRTFPFTSLCTDILRNAGRMNMQRRTGKSQTIALLLCCQRLSILCCSTFWVPRILRLFRITRLLDGYLMRWSLLNYD